ncbi:hypothetical protein Tsubulata_004662 [Turnera subulata]|uniref:Uncharacterized protein n=1 Tax=Turnera subulata TaxID=218843 RepID=A0A9Q0GDX2_9ROSI|nr:hypothetical protein Tsubulata_004662 [Turnera subulata]
MMVDVVSRKLISPSSPTPPENRSLKISAIDQLPSPVYVGTIFYYTADGHNDQSKNAARIKQLEKSLSEILTLFYPLAGRFIKEDLLIECSDQGVELLQATVSGQLSQVLNREVEPEVLNRLAPFLVESSTSPLVSIQINTFDCGGLVVGVRISHRVADGFSQLNLFMNGWAKASRDGIDKVHSPSFCLGSLFPNREIPGMIIHGIPIKKGVRIVTRVFLFNTTAISNLKGIAKRNGDAAGGLKGQPSRVDVVTALIWKVLIKVSRSRHGYLRPSVLSHGIDMRGKTNLPIPENSCGNLIRLTMARFSPSKNDMRLQDLVGLVREAIIKDVAVCKQATDYDDLFLSVSDSFRELNEELNKSDIDLYMFSSLCRVPIYEVDFGWGRPAWVSGVHKPVQAIHLIDSKDDGIEAWLSLDEKDMILLVNPSYPTPPQLQTFKISSMDQLPAPVYVGTIFYYAADENSKGATSMAERSKKLEKSLSEILTVFYPMAGRYVKENLCIDCNDHGVEYAEANVSGKLSQVLNGDLQPEQLNHFIPYPIFESPTSPLVAVQVNRFECGGLAIGLRMSHRVADGVSILSFLTGWATACKEGIGRVPSPSFSLPSLFPAREIPGISHPVPMKRGAKIVTRTFVFSRTAISKLKEIANTGSGLKGEQPSRVNVVTALIWKTLINASKAKHGHLRPSLLAHAVDLRGKTTLPIPGNSCGNLFRLSASRFLPNESSMDLHDLVLLVREGIKNAVLDSAKATDYDELFSSVSGSFREVNEELSNGEIDVYMFTSWCRFPIYEVDYGWGKPTWVSGVHKPVQVVNLMDTNDEGVEAWLSLEENSMILFQQDPEIIASTSS